MDIIDKTFFMENCQELNEIYCFAFFRIIKEIRFPQLKIFFNDAEGDLVCVEDVSVYIYLAFNSIEKSKEGYLMAEECENVISTIICHLSWLYARDLATRSHQSTGAKNIKQFLDSNDPSTYNYKPTIANQLPNSVKT
jgi:hypothetical protein